MSPWVLLGLIVLAAWCFAGSQKGQKAAAAFSPKRRKSAGGPCGVCGKYSSMLTAHEAGHAACGKALGYSVRGAIVSKDGWGETDVPGWLDNPWHTMIIAAAGAAGENRDRWTDAGLNGSKSTKWSDAWWVHKLAPQVAKKRGISTDQAIREARSEAKRLVASRSGEWRRVKAVLAKNGSYGSYGSGAAANKAKGKYLGFGLYW